MDVLRQAGLNVGPLFVTFLLGLTTIVLCYWYSLKKHRYWKDIGIPFAKPYPFVGSVLEIMKKPLQDVEQDRYVKYGRIYGHYEGNGALLSVGEPELLRSILVKDFHVFTGRRKIDTGDKITESMMSVVEGEDWKRIRSIVTPTFSTGKMKRMIGIFKECSGVLVKNFKEAAERGEPVELKSIYGAFTMDIIANSAFSTKIDSLNNPNNQFIKNAKMFFSSDFNWRFAVLTLCPVLMKIFKIAIFPREGLDFFTKVTLQIVEERKKTGQTGNDFLQLLMDTAKEAAEGGKLDPVDQDDITENYEKVENNVLKNYMAKKTLSHEELVGQCIIFFVAGYETTASTLSFVSYLLALNPDVQEKLIQEIDDILAANDGEITYEAIQNMKYLDNVIAETMRIYPPAVRLERVADEDYKLGDTGITVPKGMIISIPVYAIHRDPELFPDPEKFDPNRFTPEEKAKRHQYSFIPFGAGPRNCVGMRFALLELKVCLAYVLSNFRIKRCEKTKVPLDWSVGQGILQPKDIMVLMEPRQDTPTDL